MNKELYRPIARAITAFILIILIKFAAMLTLKNTVEFYSFMDIALSIAVIITLYVTFRPYSEFLPYGIYHIVFFLLLMVPLYFLWEVIHKNADRLSELFVLTEKRIQNK